MKKKMPKTTKPENIDEFISDFSRFYILTILYEGPAHGYSIINRFKKRVKKEVSPSLVYPFLQTTGRERLSNTHTKASWRKRKKNF